MTYENVTPQVSSGSYLTAYDYGLGGLDDLMADDSDLSMLPPGDDYGLSSVGDVAFGLEAISKPIRDTRAVVASAAMPIGSRASVTAARKLIAKSLSLGKMAHDRAQVAFRSRDERDRLVKGVDRIQGQLDRLPAGSPQADNLRTKQYGLARRALQLHKVTAVATGMAKNAVAQASLLQQIGAATALGQPQTAAVLSAMYNKIGQGSEKFRQVRKQQIINKTEGDQQFEMRQLLDKKRKLLLARVDFLVTLSFPGLEGRARVQNDLKALDRQIAELDRQIHALYHRGAGSSLGEIEGWGPFGKIAKKIGRAAKGAVKLNLAPVKFAAKFVTKGPAAAIKSIPGAMKEGFDIVRRTAADFSVGMACDVMKSKIGKVAVQAGGMLVGSYFGPVGTAVGAAAAGRANQTNERICGSLDKLGLTKGTFRTSKLGSTLKSFAGGMAKDLVNPKTLIANATSIGGAYMSTPQGQQALSNLRNVGNAQIAKIGLPQLQNADILRAGRGIVRGDASGLLRVGRGAALQYGQRAASQYGGNILRQYGGDASGFLRTAGAPALRTSMNMNVRGGMNAAARSNLINAEAQAAARQMLGF